MKIIIPMAGKGSRLRPHTLTVPKPLLPIAGEPIVKRLIDEIAKVTKKNITEIIFIIHKDFGNQIPLNLLKIAKSKGAKGIICYQEEQLGTAHALMSAEKFMTGNIIIAYADTLFKANFDIDEHVDSHILVKEVKDPSAYGVVELNQDNKIINFIEKPQTFISDLAIIGIYYFKQGEDLLKHIKKITEQDINESKEYLLTDALYNMQAEGKIFEPRKVDDWMDCGNKEIILKTNTKMLNYLFNEGKPKSPQNIELTNSKIIEPCFIDSDIILKNSTVGPNVSIGKNTTLENVVISNSIIQSNSTIKNASIKESMIGNNCKFNGLFSKINLGDFSSLE